MLPLPSIKLDFRFYWQKRRKTISQPLRLLSYFLLANSDDFLFELRSHFFWCWVCVPSHYLVMARCKYISNLFQVQLFLRNHTVRPKSPRRVHRRLPTGDQFLRCIVLVFAHPRCHQTICHYAIDPSVAFLAR